LQGLFSSAFVDTPLAIFQSDYTTVMRGASTLQHEICNGCTSAFRKRIDKKGTHRDETTDGRREDGKASRMWSYLHTPARIVGRVLDGAPLLAAGKLLKVITDYLK
jgi:hypothetical protein